MKAKLVLEAKPKNVGLARDWVCENCRTFGVKGRRVMDMKTITSEVVTNVVRHAKQPNDRKKFVLILSLYNNKLTLYVRDFGSGFTKRHGHSLHVGLTIVRTLADKVKIRSFWFGSIVKVAIRLKEVEYKKPLIERFHLINNRL